jgi:thiamine-phosphate pyrophosphorylase
MENFILAVLTLPGVFSGEADLLADLLEAGVDRLHLRKPAEEKAELEALLRRLAPRWSERLVLHGSRELALQFGIRRVHGSVDLRNGRGRSGGGPYTGGASEGLMVSTSVHDWEEFGLLPEGLEYAFVSPMFDSISKAGYRANADLLQRPGGELPCLAVGLGGVNVETLGMLLQYGWKGAAVLGWVWEEPRLAVRRFEELKKLVDG